MATINYNKLSDNRYKFFKNKKKSGTLAFDLATNTGFAFSENGKRIYSGSINLRNDKKDNRSIILYNGLAIFDKIILKTNPEFIIYEKPFHRGSGSTLLYGLSGILESLAAKYGSPISDIHASSVRKKLLDNGSTNKEDVQAYLKSKRIPFKTHDEADAISVLLSQYD